MLDDDSVVKKTATIHRERQQQALFDLIEASRQWISSASLIESEQYTAWLALKTNLSVIRDDMEKQIFLNGKEVLSKKYPGKNSQKKILLN